MPSAITAPGFTNRFAKSTSSDTSLRAGGESAPTVLSSSGDSAGVVSGGVRRYGGLGILLGRSSLGRGIGLLAT